MKFDLQYFASKKGVGSTKNGRDSNPKMLGAKIPDGKMAKTGQIIYRQRGTRVYPGKNVKRAKDDTLFALKDGIVKYTRFGDNKRRVSVEPVKKVAKKAK